MKKPPIGRLLWNVLGAESIHFIAFLLPFGRIRMSESTSRAELTISVFSFRTFLLSSFSKGKGSSEMQTPFPAQQWLESLSGELLAKALEEQRQSGYFHTLPEICRQPQTWRETCELMIKSTAAVNASLRGAKSIIFTGSGSSEYAGDCLRASVQAELGIDCQAIGGGVLLTGKTEALTVCRPRMMVSLARSGDSPESTGALSLRLEHAPEMRHLVLTRNSTGALAQTYRGHTQVSVITLGYNTNDQSLVMTSSFTNLIVAARFLGLANPPDAYRAICDQAASIAAQVFSSHFDTLPQVAESGFKRVVYLGSGARYGAAREAGSEDARDDRRPRHLSVRKLSRAPAWTDELHRQQHPGGLFYLFRPNEARLRNGPPAGTLPEEPWPAEADCGRSDPGERYRTVGCGGRMSRPQTVGRSKCGFGGRCCSTIAGFFSDACRKVCTQTRLPAIT